MSTVREINSLEELKRYRLLWRWHLDRTNEPNFFQTLTWLETYWRHYGSDGKLRVLVASSNDEPLGILPLVVQTERMRVGRVRVLTYPLSNWGTFYGPIGSNPAATLMACIGKIRRTKRDWDMIELRWVDDERQDGGRLQRALDCHGLQATKSKWDDVAIVDFHGSWEDYWLSKDDHWRNNYRRNEKRLAQHGEVRLIRYRPAGHACGESDPRWDLYRACEQIAARSWQGSSRTGTTLSHGSVQPFLREMHANAVAAGNVDLNLLLVDRRPAAFAYNYHLTGNVYGLRSGFDPQWSREGAGAVLLGRMIRDSFERGDRSLDMGPGSIRAKRYWLTSVVKSYRYTHFASTSLRPQAIRLRRWLRQWGESMAPAESIPTSGSKLP